MTAIQAFDSILVFYEVEVESRHRIFELDDHTKTKAWEIATALTEEDPKFGLLFCGRCGNGKTTFINALQSMINWLRDANYIENQNSSYLKKWNARDISSLARDEYKQYLEMRSLEKILAIDDLGEEPHEVLDYGNIKNPILELIEYRYDNQLPTFITSNLTPSEIAKKYGDRIADRLFEMVEKIVFNKKIEESYRRI